jgi:hypothetical protein
LRHQKESRYFEDWEFPVAIFRAHDVRRVAFLIEVESTHYREEERDGGNEEGFSACFQDLDDRCRAMPAARPREPSSAA